MDARKRNARIENRRKDSHVAEIWDFISLASELACASLKRTIRSNSFPGDGCINWRCKRCCSDRVKKISKFGHWRKMCPCDRVKRKCKLLPCRLIFSAAKVSIRICELSTLEPKRNWIYAGTMSVSILIIPPLGRGIRTSILPRLP